MQSLEPVLAQEIKALGGENIQVLKRAVQFEGDLKLLYRANLELRTAIRILVHFAEFKTKHENHFYKKMQSIDWAKYINLNDTFAIDGVTTSKYITHSKYMALKAKDAIVDQFRERTGRRPNVNTYDPTLRINIFLNHENVCKISFDSSGEALHKRGYRVESQEAPINEVLAAGMILLSGWQQDCDFVDPMCGSGTIPIEAAMMAHHIAPNLGREKFAFQKSKKFDPDLWELVKTEAKAKIRPYAHKIYGFDKDFKAISIAKGNAMKGEFESLVRFERKQFERLEPTSDKGVLMLNPPYDERLQIQDIEAFYKMIGDNLKQKFSGWEAWIISSNVEAMKKIGLRATRRIPLLNGSLDCKFQQFKMYSGSKKRGGSAIEAPSKEEEDV